VTGETQKKSVTTVIFLVLAG